MTSSFCMIKIEATISGRNIKLKTNLNCANKEYLNDVSIYSPKIPIENGGICGRASPKKNQCTLYTGNKDCEKNPSNLAQYWKYNLF